MRCTAKFFVLGSLAEDALARQVPYVGQEQQESAEHVEEDQRQADEIDLGGRRGVRGVVAGNVQRRRRQDTTVRGPRRGR